MSHNPPQISDFDGDVDGYEKCAGAYDQGWLAVGSGKSDKDNPYPERSDMNWWWKSGFYDCLSDIW